MARERFVNRPCLWQLLYVVVVLAYIGAAAPGFAPKLVAVPGVYWGLLLLLSLALLLPAVQSQWAEIGNGDLAAWAWPSTLRVPLERVRLVAWVFDRDRRGSGRGRMSNGAVWLAHESEQGGLIVSEVHPGPPEPFLERLAGACPHIHSLPTAAFRQAKAGGDILGRRTFLGRPFVCTAEIPDSTFVALLVLAGAWYLGTFYSWAMGAIIALPAVWLLWCAWRPTILLDKRGVSVPVGGGHRLLPWDCLLGLALAKGRGTPSGCRVFVWSGPPKGQPLPELVPQKMDVVAVRDPEGLFKELAAAAGLKVEGEIAYRA
ncbi:hypothetical protein IIA16_02290 [bacterium]|nr:hypothetical protein [bacterium]